MLPSSPIRLLQAILIAAVTMAGTVVQAVPTEPGLYATFETTHGIFTLELEFEKVPVTVANFVGLAEGSRAWVNFNTGKASNEPFFDGLKIPRAEAGFVIQMGSPTNTLSGGPGYQFGDEIDPDLQHSEAGIVSMANSGADTNGSQFFITLAATNGLNRKHAVFGAVAEGLDVVQTIGGLPGGTVTIQTVTITRNGAAAQAFDVTAWGLPVVSQTPLEFDTSEAPTAFGLNYDSKPFTEFYTFNSGNLSDWATSTIFFLDDMLSDVLDVTARSSGQERQFFRMTEAAHVPVPASLIGTTQVYDLPSSDPDQILTLTFTAGPRSSNDFDNPLGTFSLATPGGSTTTGRIGAYTWAQDLHRGRLAIILENIGLFFFYPKFRSDDAGWFTGYASGGNPDGPFPFYGTFTTSP